MYTWCYFIFHPCFQCFPTSKPPTFHLLNINDSSLKHQWIIIETLMNQRSRNSYVYVFYGWIQRNKITKSSSFIISNQIEEKHWFEKQKALIRTLSRNNWQMLLKMISVRTEEHFGQLQLKKFGTICPEEVLVRFCFAKRPWIWKFFRSQKIS